MHFYLYNNKFDRPFHFKFSEFVSFDLNIYLVRRENLKHVFNFDFILKSKDNTSNLDN